MSEMPCYKCVCGRWFGSHSLHRYECEVLARIVAAADAYDQEVARPPTLVRYHGLSMESKTQTLRIKRSQKRAGVKTYDPASVTITFNGIALKPYQVPGNVVTVSCTCASHVSPYGTRIRTVSATCPMHGNSSAVVGTLVTTGNTTIGNVSPSVGTIVNGQTVTIDPDGFARISSK